jgi:hypothetical protein
VALGWTFGRWFFEAVRWVSFFQSRIGIATVHLRRPIESYAVCMTITLGKRSLRKPRILSPLNPPKIPLAIIKNHNRRRPHNPKTRHNPHSKRSSRIPRFIRRNRPNLETAHHSKRQVVAQPPRSRKPIVDHQGEQYQERPDGCPGVEEGMCIAGFDQVVVAVVVESDHVEVG